MTERAEALAVAIMGGRKEAKKLWARRCSSRSCLIIAAYEVRGQAVIYVTRIRLSPGKAVDLELVERTIPARAWLLPDVPSEPLLVGCDHELWQAQVDDGRLVSLIAT